MTDSGSHNILREKIVPYIKEDGWFQEAVLERTMCELTELREQMDYFDDQRFSFVRELIVLLEHHPLVLSKLRGSERTQALREMAKKARNLRNRLLASYRSFLRNSYKRYLSPESGLFVEEEAVKHLRAVLSERFESNIEPDSKKTLGMICKFIDRLKENHNQ